jgi:hypothetical protein
MPVSVKVKSPQVSYENETIRSNFSYQSSVVVNQPDGQITVSEEYFPQVKNAISVHL